MNGADHAQALWHVKLSTLKFYQLLGIAQSGPQDQRNKISLRGF